MKIQNDSSLLIEEYYSQRLKLVGILKYKRAQHDNLISELESIEFEIERIKNSMREFSNKIDELEQPKIA